MFTVTLSAPALSNTDTPTVTVTTTHDIPLPDGTVVTLDVDLNDDGNFTDPGDSGYTTATLTNGVATFQVSSLPADGTYNMRPSDRLRRRRGY